MIMTYHSFQMYFGNDSRYVSQQGRTQNVVIYMLPVWSRDRAILLNMQ